MVGPMPELVPDRESPTAWIAALLNGDNSAVIITNDARLAAFENGVAYLDAD